MTALTDDSLLISGLIEGPVSFGPGDAGVQATGKEKHSFLARYGTDGTLHWLKTLGNSWSTHVKDAIALPDGGAAVVGSFDANARFGEGEGSVPPRIGGDEDRFVARYSAEGSLVWLRSFGTASWESPHDERLAREPDGTLVVRGDIERPAVFQDGQTRRELSPRETAARPEGPYQARYSPAGELLSAELGDGPWPWPARVGCCVDSSIAESARKVPEPFVAKDFATWVDQMLGGAELGRMREEELDGVLALEGTQQVFEGSSRYMDWRGRFFGQSLPRPRVFTVRDGVVQRLSITTGVSQVSMPTREGMRAILGQPYRVDNYADRYCSPPGHPRMAVDFEYSGPGSTLKTIHLRAPHPSHRCP
jgi:hypothetical protein